MAVSPEALPADLAELVEQKRFDEVEDIWTRHMGERPEDLPFFFAVAAAVKKRGAGQKALAWLRFLADYEQERRDDEARIAVLLEIARMMPGDPEIRKDLIAAIGDRFAQHPAFASVLAHFPLEKAPDPAEAGGRIVRWLRFLPGGIYFMPGRGAGRVIELNPALDVVRMEFGSAKIPLSLVSAEKNLEALASDHFLRQKIDDLASLQPLAEEEPAELLRRLLGSFRRPMTVAEIKEHLAGVVAESRWANFWTSARRHPQVLCSGEGRSAKVSWTDSADAAERAVREAFTSAPSEERLEIARKEFRRSPELARFLAEGLASAVGQAAAQHPGQAWELSQAAARIVPSEPEAFPAEKLLAVSHLPGALAEIRDPLVRQKALEAIRNGRADWADIFAEQFLHEEDARVLGALHASLAELADRRAELERKILRAPRLAPRAFLWLCQRLREEGGPAPEFLFFSLIEALRREEFAAVRSRLRELFEPGQLAVAIVQAATSEEQARQYLEALEGASGLEEHRHRAVREAVLMKFPELRAPAREVLYATPESIEARRRELAHLKQVELPANAEAMRIAKEHGDLTENFEYHAARQKHEYLSARIASLSEELARTRPLDASRIDTGEVRVGTRVRIRTERGGAERLVTILGPWDSKPEEDIYSYQSEFAQGLLGKKLGDFVTLDGREAQIVAIEPWK